MSVWTERIKEHKVWDALKHLGTAIDEAANWENNSVDEVTGIERLREILAFTGKRLAATDPFLLSVRALTDLTTKLEDVTHDLDVNNDVESANAEGDKLLVLIADILAPIPSEDLDIINESLTTYRNAITKKLKEALKAQGELSESIDAHKTALDEHIKALEDERDILKKTLSDFQSVFSSNQDTRATEYATVMSDFSTAFAKAQISFEEKISLLINDSSKQITTQQAKISTQQERAAKTYKDDLNNLHTEYVGGAKVILDEINKHRADVEELVGVIGNLGVTSGYLHEANSARTSLYIWQSSTVVALLGLIGVAFTMAFPHWMVSDFGAIKSIVGVAVNSDTAKNAVAATSANISTPQISTTFLFYQSLATRIFLSITFGIFAAYSSSQAEKYMEIERRNRKLALEFTAVGPFIAPMPIEMQNKFREELGGKSFGVAEPVKHKRRDPVTLLDVAARKELEDFILNVLDRFRTKESNSK